MAEFVTVAAAFDIVGVIFSSQTFASTMAVEALKFTDQVNSSPSIVGSYMGMGPNLNVGPKLIKAD